MILLLAFPASADLTVRDVRLGQQEGGITRFVLELDQTADYRLFVLDNPRRAVIDLPVLSWSPNLVPTGRGVVKGWRFGQFGSGTRVVLDLIDPVKVVGIQSLPPHEGGGPRLVIDLATTSPADFASLIGRNWGGRSAQALQQNAGASVNAVQSVPPASAPTAIQTADAFWCPKPPPLPAARRNMDMRPVVVIDPGHGGVDPGAIAITRKREKDITLAVARQLATKLESSGYRVVMTRSRDIFVPLQGRVRIAREANADLFISLHADAVRDRNVRGATVYTLSDKATDAEAAELAESENRADMLAGLPAAGRDNVLADIMTAMSYRASVNGGRDLSSLIVQNLRDRDIRLNDRPQRSAGFAVLKAPDIPSVLVEMGYLTSRSDADLLVNAVHQRKMVAAIASAVDGYFLRHSASGEAMAVLMRGE